MHLKIYGKGDMMKNLLSFLLILIVGISISGCGTKTPAYNGQELVALYKEKPDEVRKLENKEIILAGRVYSKRLEKSNNNDDYLILVIYQDHGNNNKIVESLIYIPIKSASSFDSVNVNDIVEAKGKLAIYEDDEVNLLCIDTKTGLSPKVTLEKSFAEIPSFGAIEFVKLFKENPQKYSGFSIKISGQILSTGQFNNVSNIYVKLFDDYEYSLSIALPFNEKDKVNNLKFGQFVEAYGEVTIDQTGKRIQIYSDKLL